MLHSLSKVGKKTIVATSLKMSVSRDVLSRRRLASVSRCITSSVYCWAAAEPEQPAAEPETVEGWS